MKKPSLYGRIPRIIIFLMILLFIGLLSIYGIKGTYSRYAQDDYCYGYKVRSWGFWTTQIQSYLHRTEFNSDRYSLTLTNSLIELLGGPKVVPVLPSLEMLVWLAGLVYVFYQLQQGIDAKTDYLIAIISALVIIFFTLYLAPNQYQILFWLSGMQPYLTPMVLATFLFGFLISIARLPKFKFTHAVGLGILSFLACGFSETTGLWQFACWSMLLGWVLIFRKRHVFARNTIRPALVLMGSAALSLVIMAFCPGNFKAAYYPDFITLILQSLSYGVGFIWIALKSTPLPYLAIILLGLFASLTYRSPRKTKTRYLVAEILAVILTVYILSVVVMLPSMYATSHYPGDRALLPAQFTLSAGLFIIGWKMAELISALQPKAFPYRTSIILQGLFGLLLCSYIVHITPRVYDKLPAYQERAQAWDLRQKLILGEKAKGIENVIAPAFDSVYGINELHYEADNWVNICAAKYYGVQTITTIDNYAGISAHPIGK